METITLDKVNKSILDLKKEIEELKEYIYEDFELADDVVKDIEASRKRPKKEFISHGQMRKGFA